jgi:hypothetical protein
MTNLVEDVVETAVPAARVAIPLVKALWPALAVLGLAGTAGGLYACHKEVVADRDHWKAEAAASKDQGKRDVAQGDAGQAALKIVADGAVKQQLDIKLHEDNSHAIAAAPGSGQTLDLHLNDVGRRSLCAWPGVYEDDPGCAGLRQPDPRPGQEAGQGNAPTAP